MATAADLQKTLKALGLDFLFDILSKANIDPTVDTTNQDQLSNYIDSNKEAQDYMKVRFAGNDIREANGLRRLKPSEYIQQEQDYLARLQANGLPIGFYDSQGDLAKMIGNDVGVTELDARIRQGYQAAQRAPQTVKDQLANLYGITDRDLAAYFLDPTIATDLIGRKKNAELFGRQITAAQIAAQGQTQAGIQLGMGTAEELAAQGISPDMAQTGFTQIQDQQQLFATTTAEAASGQQNISQEQQIAGTFGTNAAARQAIEARKRKRTAAFQQGGSLLASQAGNIGLGTVGQ
jgi:hypothetical protein